MAGAPQISSLRGGPVAIFVATGAEAKPLRRALDGTRRSPNNWDSPARIEVGRLELLLTRAGMGPDNAETAARRLFNEQPIAAALSVGVAAGLSPRMRAGDLIVGNRVALHRGSGTMPRSFPCDVGLQEWAMGLVRRSNDRHCLGPIATVERIFLTAQEKRDLAAESSAIAMDMESAAIASAAADLAVPFLAIRAILDPLEEDLNIAFGQFLDGQGEPRWLPLTRYLLARPQVIPRMMVLALRTKAICSRLGHLLRELSMFPP